MDYIKRYVFIKSARPSAPRWAGEGDGEDNQKRETRDEKRRSEEDKTPVIPPGWEVRNLRYHLDISFTVSTPLSWTDLKDSYVLLLTAILDHDAYYGFEKNLVRSIYLWCANQVEVSKLENTMYVYKINIEDNFIFQIRCEESRSIVIDHLFEHSEKIKGEICDIQFYMRGSPTNRPSLDLKKQILSDKGALFKFGKEAALFEVDLTLPYF